MFAGVLAAATVLRAQETPPATPAPAPAAAGAEGESPGEVRVETRDEAKAGEPASGEAQDGGTAAGERPAQTNPPAPADRARPVGPTPGRFEPTEKVRADFDVAFPIDI